MTKRIVVKDQPKPWRRADAIASLLAQAQPIEQPTDADRTSDAPSNEPQHQPLGRRITNALWSTAMVVSGIFAVSLAIAQVITDGAVSWRTPLFVLVSVVHVHKA